MIVVEMQSAAQEGDFSLSYTENYLDISSEANFANAWLDSSCIEGAPGFALTEQGFKLSGAQEAEVVTVSNPPRAYFFPGSERDEL
jgi:hypothetical protein